MNIVKIVALVITSWALMCLAGYVAKNTAGTDMAWWGFPTSLFSVVFCIVSAVYAIVSILSLGEKK